jgi:hypothetical protein
VVSAETTPGVVVARVAAGHYRVSFPAARKLARASIRADIHPAAPETLTQGRKCNVDANAATVYASTSGSTLGQVEFYTASYDGAEDADEEVANGSTLVFSCKVDY